MSSTTTTASPPLRPPTTTLKQLAANLAEAHDVPKKTTEAVLNGLIAEVVKRLQAGEKVRLPCPGTLQVKRLRRGPDATRRPAPRSRSPRARSWPSPRPRRPGGDLGRRLGERGGGLAAFFDSLWRRAWQ